MATSLQAMAFTEDISSTLINSIDRSRFFEIVERKKIEQFLELEGLRLDNLDHERILKLSAKAGLDYVIHGSVDVNDAGTSLDINLLSVRTRKVLLKQSFSISQTDFARNLMEIAGTLVERIKTGINQPQVSVPSVAVAPVKTPTNLEASGTNSSIHLRWQSDMKQISGFNVYRSTSSGGPFSLQATTAEPSFTDKNMTLNDVFYYCVAAVSQSGSVSERTAPVRGATAVAPLSPIFMNVEPDIRGSRLVWRSRPGSGGDPRTEAQGYRVYRKQGEDTAFSLVTRLPVDAVSYVDSGLNDGIKYVYTITSYNREGTESDYSAKLSMVPLSSPDALKVTAGKIRHVPLSWDRYASDQGEGYVVYRSEKIDGPYTVIARFDGLAVTSYTDLGLADNATYWYRLSVFKRSGSETAPSEPVSATTRNIPPAPVSLIAASAQPRKVTLKWQNAGTPADEIVTVIVYRMLEEKGVILEKIGEVDAKQNEYIDEKPVLQDKTTYHYRLAVRNSGGALSRQTEVVSATTKSPPAAPANFTGTSGGVKKTELSWDKNSETDIKEYQIFMKRSTDLDGKQITSVQENRYQDIELKDGTEYAYTVRAVDTDGLMSLFSRQVVIRTKPVPAKVIGFSAVDMVNRTVAWKPNMEKDIRNYIIYKKGFLGIQQKVATVQGTQWQVDETRDALELFVTAFDESGLESEPSDMVVFKER
jgi:fibronectin type 3 domain-containing protein